jgi:hypothetical protein
MSDNDGRKPIEQLPVLKFARGSRPVIQVVDEATGEILYSRRILGETFQPKVFRHGRYRVNLGIDKPNKKSLQGLASAPDNTQMILLKEF